MSTNETLEQQRDQELWKQARRRVSFRRHLTVYIIVNAFLWAMWLFTDSGRYEKTPWPIFPMLGWGIGLAFDFYGAYISNQATAVEREYEKLKNQQK